MKRVLSAFIACFLLASSAPPAAAHNWDVCGDGSNLRWAGTTITNWYPGTWPTLYRAGVSNGRLEFNRSDFDYLYAASGAVTIWADLGSANTNIAGLTTLAPDCANNRILDVNLYYNFSHFNASPHTGRQYQCTAIHEFGHGVGLGHTMTNVSILHYEHGQRCHNWIVDTLQPHDFTDINTRY